VRNVTNVRNLRNEINERRGWLAGSMKEIFIEPGPEFRFVK